MPLPSLQKHGPLPAVVQFTDVFCQRETEKKLHQSKRLTKSALEGFRGRVSHKTSLILFNF